MIGFLLLLLYPAMASAGVNDEIAMANLTANLGQSITDFGKDLMSVIGNGNGKEDNKNENIIMSPITIHMLMTMLYFGSPETSDTFKQLEHALHLNGSQGQSHASAYSRILKNYKKFYPREEGKTSLRLASTIVTSDGFTVKENYKTLLKQSFETESQKFGQPKEAVTIVNDWANDTTNGLIPKVLNEEDVDSLTRMILASACYFKSDWLYKFDKKDTGPMKFKLASGKEVQLKKGMNQKKIKLRFAVMEDYQVLELPYKNQDFRMYIGLPNENTVAALNALAAKFDMAAFEDRLIPTTINKLQMPSFDATKSIDLEKPLRAMGINDIFDQADFSKISNEAISVSKIKTKTVVKVDEEGSEAAAVAVAIMSRRSNPDTNDFIVNRPFVFVIYNQRFKAPLFIGQILNPQ